MAYEPTIGEITGGNIDAGINTGEPAVNIDLSPGIKAANDAAQFKANNDWRKYTTHLDQVNKFAQNHQLDFTGVMAEDVADIDKLANVFWDKVQKNPRLLEGINIDADWRKAQSAIAKSKADHGVLVLQEDYRQKNPDLLNERNNQIALNYRQAGLNNRNASMLNWALPKTLNIDELTNAATKQIEQPVQPVTRRLNDPSTGAYTGSLERVEGLTKVDKNAYDSLGKAAYNSLQKIDKYGHTVKEAAKDMYSMLDPETKRDVDTLAKKNGRSPEEEYFAQSWSARYKAEGGKPISTRFEDKAFDVNQKLNSDLILEAARAKDARALEAMKESIKFNFEGKKDEQKADALVRFGSATLQDAIKNGRTITVSQGGKDTQVKELNLPPQILEKFGPTGKIVTKDVFGKDSETTIGANTPPDVIQYDPAEHKYKIVHYAKDKNGKIETDKHGAKKIDSKLTKDISEDAFMVTVASSIYDKNDAPQAYAFAKNLMKGRHLSDFNEAEIKQPESGNGGGLKGVTIKGTQNIKNDPLGIFKK